MNKYKRENNAKTCSDISRKNLLVHFPYKTKVFINFFYHVRAESQIFQVSVSSYDVLEEAASNEKS